MAERIRVGLIGASASGRGSDWAARSHVPALKALPDYELKAVGTAHEDTAGAAAEAFGVELAYHDVNQMVANPDIDLVVVSVRVPAHRELVMASLKAGKATFCEWPLGANLAEAEEMATFATERGIRTVAGLQARSEPTVVYAKELLEQGVIGDALTVNFSIMNPGGVERHSDRAWQADPASGGNTLMISAGHGLDALCYILGEFAEVSARVTTQIKEWRLTDTGETVPTRSPDNVSIVGRLQNGAEVSAQIASVPPKVASGWRLEAYGTKGSLTLRAGFSLNMGGDTQLLLGEGSNPPRSIPVSKRFTLTPEGISQGQAFNVAQAYVRLARAWKSGETYQPDFAAALRTHVLLDTIERSSAEGRSVKIT
jgi:predicted dehydrogenase